MSDLPLAWAEATLEELTDPTRVVCYGILMPKAHVESGVPYVRVKDFPDGRISLASLRRTAPEIAAKYPRSRLEPGDVLLSIRGSYGRVAIVPEALNGGNITQDTARIAPMPGISHEFVAFFLQSNAAQQYFRRVARGVAVKGVNIGDLRALRLPIPPAAEQRRIVEAIEEQLSRIEAAESALQSARKRLGQLISRIIDRAFSDEWPVRSVDDVAEIITGSTPSPKKAEFWGEGLQFFTPGDLRPGGKVSAAQRALTEAGAAVARAVPARSVLLTCIGATIGKTSLAVVPCATNQQINAVIPRPEVALPEYLLAVFSADRFQKTIFDNSSNTTMPILNKSRLANLPIPCPPLSEQDRVVAEVEQCVSIVEAMNAAIDSALVRAQRLRTAILDRAFRGTLVPQDPSDEPASVLLERIAQKRASDQPKRARKASTRRSRSG